MKFTITILLFFISAAIFAQGPGHTSVVTYSSNYGNGTQTLSVFKPYDSTSSSFRHPVIIALNGNGERGSTSQAGGSVGDLCNHGATMRFYNNTYNRYSTFIVLSPVLPTSQGLWPAAYVKDVIDYMKANLGSMIDTSQVYVTGLSLGGGGVLNFISDNVRGTYYSNFIAGAAAFSNTADWQDEATFFSHIYDCNLPMIVYGCLDDANNNGSTKAAVDYMLARQNITYPSRTPQIKFVRPNTGGHAGGWVYGYDTTNTLTLTVDSSGLGGTTNRTYVNNPNLYVRLLSSSRQPSTPVAPGCASYITPANTSTIATTTTATLTWNAVSNATSYDVYLWTGATPPATPVNTTSASYAATGLTASALYNWYVVPKNTAGSATGCSSGAFTFTTATPVSPPACTNNTAPANASTIATSTSATLAWNVASGATSYDIFLWSGATPPSTATYNTTSVSYNATGLTAATLYHWYVVPVNAGGSATGCSSANTTTFTTATSNGGSGLQGVYYNGIALTGTPLLTRIDSTINFDLGFLSPAPGTVPTDLYSVRWAGQVQAVFSETYTFYTQADDGIRLWVNGVQLVDNWQNQGTTERSGTISLVAGQKYDIVVEYYENTGGAVAKLLWSSASTTKAIVPVTQLYPPGSAPSCVTNTAPANGTTIVSTSATTLTWNTASGADSYDIYLWTGATPPSAATYNTTTTSYAVTGLTPSSLYNWYVIPKNASGPATGCSTANKTTFTTNGSGGIGLQGVYYNGITLTGTPLLTRIDSTVNFDLGFLSPAPGTVPTDLYSVRWTGQVQAVFSETYTFYTQADDGIRLWVNGVQLVDNWQNQGTTERSGTISLVAGQKYDIVVEYYENTGGATSKLLWSSASTTKAIIPALQLYPPGSGARLINTAAVITTPQTTDPVTETVLLNPNPVFQGQDARLQLTSNASANSRIQIINSTGAVISAQRASLTRGLNFIQLKTGNLARGVYIIEVLNAGKSGRILKLVVI